MFEQLFFKANPPVDYAIPFHVYWVLRVQLLKKVDLHLLLHSSTKRRHGISMTLYIIGV